MTPTPPILNSTPATEIWRLQTLALWYSWQAHKWLYIAPTKRGFIYWVYLTDSHLFYQHETTFVEHFWIVTNTSKRYFWDVSEASQNKHFFEICLRWLKDVIWKTSFLRCIWDVLKTSQKDIFFEMYLRCLKDVTKKRRLFWDLSKRSMRCLSHWRFNWNISKTSHAGWVQCILNTVRLCFNKVSGLLRHD